MTTIIGADDVLLNRKVAIKILRSESESAVVTARFLHEARIAFTMQSEHVVRVYDFGRLDSGEPFVVTEYLRGRNLRTWLSEDGPLPAETAVDFILQASEAIAEAHGRGILHCDMKPGNLLAGEGDKGAVATVKVLELGWWSRTSEADRVEGLVVGTPLYMAPEQLTSARDLDARTDIWGLGVTLFELLTGRLPFEESWKRRFASIQDWESPALRNFSKLLPPGLDGVILKCLKPHREDRYASVTDFAKALSDLGSDHSGPTT
jgi:serine/threonine-protein kinase